MKSRIEQLQEFLEEDGNDSFLKYALALEYVRIDEKDAAKDCFLQLVAEDENYLASYYQLGKLYESVNDLEDAIEIYKKGIKSDSDNYGLLKNTILLQIDIKKYEAAIALSTFGLEMFPAQPLLYLVNGVANNELKNADQAIEILEIGLDYLFDDPKMECDFYQQLTIAYTLKGNTKKAKLYHKKALDLSITKQKKDN